MSLIGKVAMVMDRGRLALNVGASSGVEQGDIFVVFEEGAEVVDPDSGESLGRIERVKATVSVVHVQEKLSLAEPPPDEEPAPDPEPDVLSGRMAQVRTAVTRGPKPRRREPVRVGDLARRL